jgi:hypothetical protein
LRYYQDVAKMHSQTPNAALPRVQCDFNACGWSGEQDDDCYYVFDKEALAELGPFDGMRLLAIDDEGDGEVIGCEGRLELCHDSWRIRPVEGSWFRGSA